MADEIVVKVEGTDEPAAVVEETAGAVIEAAVVIADKIDEARQEGAAEAEKTQEIVYTLGDLFAQVEGLRQQIGVAIDLMMGLSDQVAALTILEVAETIEDHTEKEVEAIVETAEEVAPVIEQPVVAVEPEIRKSTKRYLI